MPGAELRDDRADPRGPGTGRQSEQAPGPAAEQDRPLCCTACRGPVTAAAQRSVQAGRHEHVCANPEGILFRIGCFAQAPGCIIIGRPTSRWTWFPGFRWRVALCGRCGAHLGWHFGDGSGDGFYGLIINRLMDCDAH